MGILERAFSFTAHIWSTWWNNLEPGGEIKVGQALLVLHSYSTLHRCMTENGEVGLSLAAEKSRTGLAERLMENTK